jgi:hypothetical protein
MTPKEKAAELVEKMYNSALYVASKYAAKQCAIIAVDEILNAHLFDLEEKKYWQQVKQEIENL